MKYVFTLICMLALVTAGAQKTQHEVNTGAYRCVYTALDGRIDGHYVSYYKNGKKRAEGNFKNHQRDSTWIVWDSLGNKIADRHYRSPLEMAETRTLDTAKSVLDKVYIKSHKKTIDCKYLQHSDDVMWSKRIWRFIPKTAENAWLFKSHDLTRQMAGAIKRGQLTAYSGSNDQFAMPFEGFNADTSANVIGYRIKEDWYFDKTRSVMDVKIVALAPVIQKQDTKDSVNLCWVYFPDLKPLLAGIDVFYCYRQSDMKEVFEHRQFKSEIYKESNVYDRTLADYLPLSKRQAESERIEMDMIESEHDLWTRNK